MTVFDVSTVAQQQSRHLRPLSDRSRFAGKALRFFSTPGCTDCLPVSLYHNICQMLLAPIKRQLLEDLQNDLFLQPVMETDAVITTSVRVDNKHLLADLSCSSFVVRYGKWLQHILQVLQVLVRLPSRIDLTGLQTQAYTICGAAAVM
eukprot:scaffold310148_cov19-Prasinocladus_malaysianus.AAC.1